MAKKEKKEAAHSLTSALKKKKKGKEPEPSSDVVLDSAKQTESDLQSLLKGSSEGKDVFKPLAKKEEKAEPHLTHEAKNKIAEAYMMEDIPLSQRKSTKSQEQAIEPDELEKLKVGEKDMQTNNIQVFSEKKLPDKVIPATTTSLDKEIYEKLAIFFENFLKNYNERYIRWEESISNILAILRKMRKYTKKNTEDLIESINYLFNKIQTNLEQFKVKRDEVEKIAGVDILTLSGEFKKVLGLLELQIKEYQLKKSTDEFIHKQKGYSNT
jgi:hypothetical protein